MTVVVRDSETLRVVHGRLYHNEERKDSQNAAAVR
jgi:hypothetical protein